MAFRGLTLIRSTTTRSPRARACFVSVISPRAKTEAKTTSPKQNFSTAATAVSNDFVFSDEHTEALMSALGTLRESDLKRREASVPHARAVEIDLTPESVSSFVANDGKNVDKVLILLRHSEAEHNSFEREWCKAGGNPSQAIASEDYPRDPWLTKRGIGQTLNNARKTAQCFNNETGLIPDLFVVSPLRRAVITGLLSFPKLSPASIRNIQWICHPDLMEGATDGRRIHPAHVVSEVHELEGWFPGMDYSLLDHSVFANGTGTHELPSGEISAESKYDLIRRTDNFLRWIKQRPERVIAVSSHSGWLKSFCGFTLDCEPHGYSTEPFRTGEMRALAIKFES